MKYLPLMSGLRYSITSILLFVFFLNSTAQVKSYRKLKIDSLNVTSLTGKVLDDAIELDSVFSVLINKHLIIKDSNALNRLTDERNWINNVYINKPELFKSTQIAIDKSNLYLFVCDSVNLIRIPIKFEYIDNINSIQLIPSDFPPLNFRIGTMYFDKLTGRLRYFNGKKWRKL